MKKIFALILLFSGFASSSFAQAHANATASANILAPITLTNKSDMAFGDIAVNNTGGTVTLPAHAGGIIASDRTFTGGITFPTSTNPVSDAEFTVTGEKATTYAIILPASCIINNGTNNMTIDNYVTDLGTTTPTLDGTTGTQTFYVGSTLHVGPSQDHGAYSGTFTVTVNYN